MTEKRDMAGGERLCAEIGRIKAGWPFSRRQAGAALALLLCAAIPPAAAQDAAQEENAAATRERLERIERELTERERHYRALARQAEEEGRKAESLTREIMAVTARVQSIEERVAGLELKLESLREMLAENEAALAERRDKMARTLAALQRLAQRPDELALLRPDEAEDTIKTALLLREIVPQLERQAKEFGRQVERIVALRTEIDSERRALAGQQQELDANRAALERLREQREAERRRLLSEAEDEAARVEELASQAKNLEELLAALERERERRLAAARDAADRLGRKPRPDETAQPFPEPRGRLPLPARGSLLSGFGEAGDKVRDKGIVIATLAGAQVVAPYDGRVAFAGPFGGYGRLLIIAHGDGYHTLLAGMGSIYASVGQWVLAGEPVGAMAEEGDVGDSGAPSNDAAPRLYVELRRNGTPVDPLPWLAAGLGKVS